MYESNISLPDTSSLLTLSEGVFSIKTPPIHFSVTLNDSCIIWNLIVSSTMNISNSWKTCTPTHSDLIPYGVILMLLMKSS